MVHSFAPLIESVYKVDPQKLTLYVDISHLKWPLMYRMETLENRIVIVVFHYEHGII